MSTVNVKSTEHVSISGLEIIPDFINDEDANELLKNIDNNDWEEKNYYNEKFRPDRSRRVQHYGVMIPSEDQLVLDRPNKLPSFVDDLLKKLNDCNDIKFDQLTINDYPFLAYMPYHIDSHSDFEDCIAIVSIHSSIVMQMFNPITKEVKHIWLPKNSLLIMEGESRYLWEHGIVSRRYDKIDESTKIKRERRISLAFRKFRGRPCDCEWKLTCIGQNEGIYRKLPSRLADAVPMLRRQKVIK